MRTGLAWAGASIAACSGAPAATAPRAGEATTETIVLVRHGEKPAAGLGQLTCQGLNRALALPAVLERAFGRPDAIYAPDPAEPKRDAGRDYDYVRPLATIEPTAIAFGLPVHASIGVSHPDQLQAALQAPERRQGVILVAWEHRVLVTLARALMTAHGGAAASVPDWPATDFDTMFVIRLRWSGDQASATFAVRRQGLDGQSVACPGMP